LPFMIALADTKLGGDFFCVASLVWAGVWVERDMGYLSVLNQPASLATPLWALYFAFGITTTAMCVWLVVKTRSFFTEWKAIVSLIVLFLLGLSAYIYLPLASMTNPPVNWGYPRTVEGFFHVLTRGQFERLHATENFDSLVRQILMFGDIALREFSLPYLIAAAIPFWFLHKMQARERNWMLALLAFFIGLSLLMLVLLNPPPERQVVELIQPYFSASHVILAVWSGYGLVLLGIVLARKRSS
jgi:hypothetical protein